MLCVNTCFCNTLLSISISLLVAMVMVRLGGNGTLGLMARLGWCAAPFDQNIDNQGYMLFKT
jgi:hypothetical protein